MRINSVPDVKCFRNNKNVLRAQSMVWHFVRHPVLEALPIMKLFFYETEPNILTERGKSVLQYLNCKRQKDDTHSPHAICSKRFLVSKQVLMLVHPPWFGTLWPIHAPKLRILKGSYHLRTLTATQ